MNGEVGDKFYIIKSGKLECFNDNQTFFPRIEKNMYGEQYIISNATEFNENVILNLMMSRKLPKGKSCLGSFTTHDDKSAMLHGGKNYCNQTTIIQATLPMCNPYFIDGYNSSVKKGL